MALLETVLVEGDYNSEHPQNNTPSKAADIQARYWAYLFDNLHHAIDEIYCTCEADESIIECQEVIMTLEVCKKDFEGLIKRIEVQNVFEYSGEDDRPSSVAWEVRKSPSKSRQTTSLVCFKEQLHTAKKYSENAISLDQVSEEVPLGQSENDDVEIVPESISVCNGKETSHSFGEEREVEDTDKNNCHSGSIGHIEKCDSGGTLHQSAKSTEQSDSMTFDDQFPSKARESRSPGRVVQLHQKLSSPLRKRSLCESIKILEEKQVKAQLFRDKMQEERAHRSKVISQKISGVRQSQNTKTMERKEAMEVRLVKAEKLRETHLQQIIRKAQEEDAKVNEIAFINSLEAQNKKIEVLERHQGVEARLQDREEERLKKKVENLAKEEAAHERRKAIEAERQAKLLELDYKRREQNAKIEQMKAQREKAREEAAKEREKRLEARRAGLLSSAEELEKKIQLKHDESSKRYDQLLEQKKGKAVSTSLCRNSSSDYAPRVEAYQKKKWCSVCHVKIVSEVYLMSHLRGKKHRESLQMKCLSEQFDPLSVIVLAPEEVQTQTVSVEVQERLKASKKRAKRLRQRMAARMREHKAPCLQSGILTSKYHSRFIKLIKDVNRLLDCFNVHQQWDSHHVSQMEKVLGELNRIFITKKREDQTVFCQLGGLASLSQLLLCYVDKCSLLEQKKLYTLPTRPLLLTLKIMEIICSDHTPNSQYFILSNKFSPLVDLISHFFIVSEISCQKDVNIEGISMESDIKHINICGSVFSLMAVIISNAVQEPIDHLVIKDCISYSVCSGLIDRLAEYFRTITGPFEDSTTAYLILSGLNMLTAYTASLHFDVKDVFTVKPDDSTQLMCVLRQTELGGILSLVYALLLHDGPPRHSSIPPSLPMHILSITTAAIRVLNNTAILALRAVQNCLGEEGISLELRHVLGYLLWYCTHHKHEQLLHEVILAIGYFSVLHVENQVVTLYLMFLLAGRSPTLLQLLCGLPFQYFSDPNLAKLLYPTLISACYDVQDNKDVLELDVNSQLICVYLQNEMFEAESKSEEGTTVQDFFSLKHRFPQSHWQSALTFFQQTNLPSVFS